jgi:hypothetical protein
VSHSLFASVGGRMNLFSSEEALIGHSSFE